MVEFTHEVTWSWIFVCCEVFCLFCFLNYSINFISSNWSVLISYFLLIQSWEIVQFQELCPLLLVCPCIGMQLSIAISYDRFYFCVISCNFSSFVSDFINLPPPLLMSLAKCLSILSFQRTSSYFYWSLLFFPSPFPFFLLWSLWLLSPS